MLKIIFKVILITRRCTEFVRDSCVAVGSKEGRHIELVRLVDVYNSAEVRFLKR